MGKGKTILLLCGKSGSGKTTVAGLMEKKYGLKQVVSYSDRPMRCKEEKGHIFVSPGEFDMIPEEEMVAYTEFSGHRYCATSSQVEESDIYVIDPKGIKEFLRRYKGKKTPVAVYLTAPENLLATRMAARGDGLYDIMKRINHDREAFKGASGICDHTVFITPDKTPEKVAEELLIRMIAAKGKKKLTA